MSPVVTHCEQIAPVIDLINRTFRLKEGCAPTMQQEFPLLLCEENKDNICVIKEENKVVSVVNFLKQTVLIEGYPIAVASVGAVCTEEGCRCRGYSSLILDNVEAQAQAAGIDVLLISGTRGLYRRRACSLVYPFLEYHIKPQALCPDFTLRDYSDSDLPELMRLYHGNATRFSRTAEEFALLVPSATIPWGLRSFHKYVLAQGESLLGYLFLTLYSKGQTKTGCVLEATAPPELLQQALALAAHRLGLEEISYHVHQQDKKHHLLHAPPPSKGAQEGTLKILNFQNLMQHLQSYFLEYLSPQEIQTMTNQSAKLSLEEQNKLLFGGEIPEQAKANSALFQKVFPLPFPWLGNLNYQ